MAAIDEIPINNVSRLLRILMRVLHVIPSIADSHGGPSLAVLLMTKSLSARGVDVTVATTDDGGSGSRMSAMELNARSGQFAENGVRIVFAPKRTELYKFSPGLAIWLWSNIRQYDILHIHALFSFTSVAAGRIAAFRRVPYVVRPLGVLGNYGMVERRRKIKRLSLAVIEGPVLKRAAAVQFTSKNELDEANLLGVTIRPVIVPLGVPTPPAADPSTLLAEIGAPLGQPRILFLSRIDPKKNLDGLLRALAMVESVGSAAPFLLVAGDGDPVYVASLRRLAEELGLGARVAWLGRVEGARKAAVWAAADFFALPSHSENFGIAAAEAMLASLPALVGEGVAIGAAAAAVDAVRLTSSDPAAIAAGLERLLSDRQAASELGVRARVYASEQFSIPVMAQRLETLYTDILAAG